MKAAFLRSSAGFTFLCVFICSCGVLTIKTPKIFAKITFYNIKNQI